MHRFQNFDGVYAVVSCQIDNKLDVVKFFSGTF